MFYTIYSFSKKQNVIVNNIKPLHTVKYLSKIVVKVLEASYFYQNIY